MLIVRRVGALLLVVAALGIWFGLAPDDLPDVDVSKQIALIESEDDLNNASTEGAPQQQVVNGWTQNKYLELLARGQQDAANRVSDPDDRPAALIGVVVGGLALIAGTSTRPDDGKSSKYPVAGGARIATPGSVDPAAPPAMPHAPVPPPGEHSSR